MENWKHPALPDLLRLKTNEKIIKDFIKEIEVAPLKLREINVYGLKKLTYLYDKFGQRFQYVPLSDRDWILRSFGSDGMQNTILSERDTFVSSWGKKENVGVSYKYQDKPHYFPPSLLQGALSPDEKWVAKLYQHSYLEQSLLVVKNAKESDLVMIAFHDRIEEFLWVPNSTQIIFTASGSLRYRDGVYLWNLRTNATKQLIGKENNLPGGASVDHAHQWYLSLGGINKNEDLAYVFLYPRITDVLEFSQFFKNNSLQIFNLNSEKLIKNEQKFDLHPLSLLRGLKSVQSCQRGSLLQKRWCELSLEGSFEKALNQWQTFGELAAGEPILSYSLLVLTLLYHDAVKKWDLKMRENLRDEQGETEELNDKKIREILSSYGAEIAQTLKMLPLAPSWVQGMSHNLWNVLIEKKYLPYQFSQLSYPENIQDH